MPVVSILAPTYQHERYIRQCIESVIAQGFADWELLILDDGSDDGTEAIARSFTDPRVRYLRRPHEGIAGLGRLYRMGLDHARGHLIAVIEADDFWPPSKLSSLVPLMEDPGVIGAYGITERVNEHGVPLNRTIPPTSFVSGHTASVLRNDPPGSLTAAMARADVLCVATQSLLVRKSALESIGGFIATDDGCIVDMPTVFELSMRGSLAFCPEITAFYRLHPTNTTRHLPSWIRIAKGQRDFLRRFFEMHAGQLPLTAAEKTEAVERWDMAQLTARLAYGRRLLIDQQWKAARTEFASVISDDTSVPRRAAAAAGWMASWVGVDIEWAYRLIGRNVVAAN